MLFVIDWVIVGASFLVGAVTGVTIAYFWDEIKAWANRVVGYILDAVNHAIEVISDIIVSLIKEGNKYYREAKAYVMNAYTGEVRIEGRRQQIDQSQIPDEYLEDLKRKAAMLLMKRSAA
ncbi:hypothetical protein [Planktothricoides sp. SR001]|jgi:hypothetical protein|uniref:hypothetical protein n=1 Tax=Planktothricoides sp. SR001 TaxID=1705388 RepID=UPI0006C86D67|nr:hypothetical protein [Planktothricoides sp. SR001]